MSGRVKPWEAAGGREYHLESNSLLSNVRCTCLKNTVNYPPAQPPDEMGVMAVSPRPLPIILPPQISRIALKPNHFYYPPAALPGAPLGPQMLALGTVLRVP